MRDNEYFNLMTGGSDGGVLLVSPETTGAYDIIIIEKSAILTVLEDDAATDLLAAKNLGGFTFTSERLLSAGEGHTIKKVTFTGAAIWGYTKT